VGYYLKRAEKAQSDAFFAAYGIYSLGITFTQSFRLTAVSRIVQGRQDAISVLLGAVMLIAGVFAVPMVVLAAPLARLLVEADPSGVASSALRILWIALAGQLLASMLATVLAVRGYFKAIGMASLLVGLVSVMTFLLTQEALGIEAAATGLAAGAASLVAVLIAVLVRSGWRPRRPDRATVIAMAAEAAHLIVASLTFLGATVSYVVCIALAARQEPGEATLFAYGYVIAVMLLGVTANVAAMVRSPAIVASFDRTVDAAATGLWSFRFTLVLAGPVVAMALLVGEPVIGLALGSGFSNADVNSILLVLALLVGWLFGSAAGIFAIVELLARGALRRLALLAGLQVTALTAAAVMGAEVAGIKGIATALSAVALAVLLVQLRWAYGAAWRASVVGLANSGAREVAVLGFAVAPSATLLVLAGRTPVATLAAALLAAVLLAVATWIGWPRESRSLLGLAGARVRQGTPDHGEPCTTLPSP